MSTIGSTLSAIRDLLAAALATTPEIRVLPPGSPVKPPCVLVAPGDPVATPVPPDMWAARSTPEWEVTVQVIALPTPAHGDAVTTQARVTALADRLLAALADYLPRVDSVAGIFTETGQAYDAATLTLTIQKGITP